MSPYAPAQERARREALVLRARRATPRDPAWIVCADDALRRAMERLTAARGGAFARFGSLDELCQSLEARLALPFARAPEAHERARVVEACLAERGVTVSGHGAAGSYRTALALVPVLDRLRAHGWDGASAPNDLPALPPDAAALVAAHVELLGDLVQELDAWTLSTTALDPVARLRRCTRALRQGDAPLPGLVALEGYWRVTPAERQLLEALQHRGADVDVAPWVVGYPSALPLPSAPPADGLLAAIDAGSPGCSRDDGSVTLVTAADPHEEARLTAAWIAERCARGSAPNDHAVLVDATSGGFDRMRRALEAHGLPTRGVSTVATRDTVPWQVFCACIRLGWRGVDVFDLATVLSAPGAGVWGRHRDRLVAMLRREVPGDWHAVRTLLDAFVDAAVEGAEAEALVQREAQEAVRRRVSELVDLWSWHGPLRRLMAGERAESLVVFVRETVARFLNPVRHIESVHDPRTQTLWVEAVAQVADAAHTALRRTVELGASLPDTPGAWLADVEALLGVVTDGDGALRGDGVELLTSPWQLGARPAVLVVHGFTRDRVPAPTPPTLVLGPLERAWLSTTDDDLAALPDEGAAVDDARREIRKALCVATERVVLVAPLRSVTGDPRLPSLAWDDLRSLLPPDARHHAPLPLDRWVTNDLGPALRDPLWQRDVAFASLGAGYVASATERCAPLAAGSWAVRDAARARFTPTLDFAVGDLVASALDEAVYTPRALETLLKCRYAFLTGTLLGLRPLRLARRPTLGTGERLRVATAAIRGLGDDGDLARSLDDAVKAEVPWAMAPGNEVALAELRRAVERFLRRYVQLQRALQLGAAHPPPDEPTSATVRLPGGRELQVTHGAVATAGEAVVELTAGSTQRLPALREAGLDVASALAPTEGAGTVVRLSLTRAEGDLVSRRGHRRGGEAPEVDATLVRASTLDEHRAKVLDALGREFEALHAADARYAPHDEARAKELEKLMASECPRCAMRLGCRFGMGEAAPSTSPTSQGSPSAHPGLRSDRPQGRAHASPAMESLPEPGSAGDPTPAQGERSATHGTLNPGTLYGLDGEATP